MARDSGTSGRWLFQTLQGRHLDIADLTPRERRTYLEFVRLAGGPAILAHPPGDGMSAAERAGLFTPEGLREHCLAVLRGSFPEPELAAATRGLLWEIVEDLAQRVGVARGQFTLEDVRHDPRFFLRRLHSDFSSLKAFAEKTGIEYTQASRVSKSGSISVDKLREAARNTGRAFLVVRTDDPPAPSRITCRDRTHEETGMRIQALNAVLTRLRFAPEMIAEVLGLEYTARSGDDPMAVTATLHRAATRTREFGLNQKLTDVHEFAPVFVVLPDLSSGSTADVASHAFLFPALEWNWFEELGFPAVLVPNAQVTRPVLVGLRGGTDDVSSRGRPMLRVSVGNQTFDEIRLTVSPPQRSGDARWWRLDEDLLHTTVFLAYPGDTVNHRPPLDADVIARHLVVFRGAHNDLLAAKESAFFVHPVVVRWCRALKWPVPTPEQIREATGRPLSLSILGSFAVRVPTGDSATPIPAIQGQSPRTEGAVQPLRHGRSATIRR